MQNDVEKVKKDLKKHYKLGVKMFVYMQLCFLSLLLITSKL